MTLALDDRQRAMLAQMGVRVFERLPGGPAALPAKAVSAVPAAERTAAPVIKRPAPPLVAPAPGVETAPGPTPDAPSGPPDTDTLLRADWQSLSRLVASCRACGACSGAQPVFGSGDCPARWLIVGDPPDENEAAEGAPFVGPAGVLLDNMLRALGLDRRTNVFLTPIMKCRPPGSRNPTAQELAQCEPVLRRQVQLLQPKVIVVMGRFAVPALLGTAEPIGKLRGRAHQYQRVPVVATYHPTYLLRNLSDKAKAWADLCLARELAGAPAD